MKATNDNSAFNFLCPHCSQSLKATPELIGNSLDCPNCGKSFTVPNSKNVATRNIPTPSRNLVVTVLVTALITSAFWWATPFISHAKGKQQAEGALSALREGFVSSGDSAYDKKKKLEKQKMESVLKNQVSLKFDGNQSVTIMNNSDFEIESIAFEYLNDDRLRVASGHVTFSNLGSGEALKSGETATKDISSHETVKPGFKVRPWYAQFSSQMDSVSFPD